MVLVTLTTYSEDVRWSRAYGDEVAEFWVRVEELLFEPDRLEIFVSDINKTEYKRTRGVI